jgi:putative ABC transport system ATP-binding protein
MTASLSASVSISTIRVDLVSKQYRRGREMVAAVQGASLELWSHKMTALIGPSGSGKTTLLNMIIGAEPPDEGAVHGIPPTDDWGALSVVPQSLGLLNELTMLENVTLPLRFGATQAYPAVELLDSLGIAHLADRSPAETSLGEQQRVAVARAIIASPAILVADEPTSHQDEANVHRVLDSLAACAASGSAVLIATHDQRVIEQCDVILGLTDGAIMALR